MENTLSETENLQPLRSQLLKTLCILSFIMCGIGLLQGIIGIFQDTDEAKQAQIEQLRTIKPDLADQMENEMITLQDNPYSKIAPYLEVLYVLASFLGVLLMWNFNKKGFYIYSIAEILPYTAYLFIGKNTFSLASSVVPGGNAIAMIFIIIMVATDLVFVGLYSKCLKEMK
ncbi:MAG: hypothetical protein ACK504_01625 [Bacteroidota bacterium]